MADGRAALHGHLGQKVIVGTTTLHYLCGRLLALEADTALFAVGERRVRVPLAHVETVTVATAAQAEFVK
jgi:hypothetical protein